MRVLVTGANGYVGQRVCQKRLTQTVQVVGTVRDADRATSLPEGIEPVVLPLDQPDDWGAATQSVDAVIHTAFAGHNTEFLQAVAWEHEAIAAMLSEMTGTGKTLIVSNGTVFLGDSGDSALSEDAPIIADHPAAVRGFATSQVFAGHVTGIRATELRLASFVYGHGGSIFVPAMLAAARRDGRSIFVGDGMARTSTLHVDAAADAYVAALMTPDAAGSYHVASSDSPTVREIAQAVAIAADGATLVSVDQDEAATALDPFTAAFLTVNNRL
ncbi:MAG: NAD-dependent epimerase/dehydratase family protein, partial [Pseudomonadota bacterium]